MTRLTGLGWVVWRGLGRNRDNCQRLCVRYTGDNVDWRGRGRQRVSCTRIHTLQDAEVCYHPVWPDLPGLRARAGTAAGDQCVSLCAVIDRTTSSGSGLIVG